MSAIQATQESGREWSLEDRELVFLGDASSRLERRQIEEWLEREASGIPHELIWLPPSRRGRGARYADPLLERRLRAGDDALLVPLRVAWLPPERMGKRSVTLADLLKFGDPRDPDPLRQHLILSRSPDRCRIVVGAPASIDELLSAHNQSVEIRTPGEFVVRRAWLALERAERKLRGNRYKVPKFVAEDLTGSQEFAAAVGRIAESEGRTTESAARRSHRYVREIAASHSPLVIDLIANAIHWLYRQGYGAIHYDEHEIRTLYELGQDHPLVFLPSHKSQLDRLVLQYLLWENDLPPNHTAGGINLNFFPVGQLVRRTGVFFIRRSFKDNELYKHVLRSYIDYLVEKRFPLEWYLEGGRSRSGKLLPPRFGMLSYVVDSHVRGKADDVFLIPTSIAYDQIFDVGSYAAEQQGTAKESESVGWLIESIRTLRRRYGDIYVRFGEPISLNAEVAPEASEDERALNVQKLAFKALRGVNKVTPITPTSLVTLALLANEDKAMTVEEIREELRSLVGYIIRRRLPTTERVRFGGTIQVREVLDRLEEHNIVTRFDEGPVPVYRIQDKQYLAAAYYRNTIVHFFVTGAIAELALLRAAESDLTDVGEVFWQEAMRLRDLLKFEFFFSDKEAFTEELTYELDRFREGWETSLAEGPAGARDLLGHLRPLRSHWALGPFLEAYLVVGDALESQSPGEKIDSKQLLAECLGLGEQYRLQRKITQAEAVSQVLFKSAIGLADNRRLLEPRDHVEADRQAFAAEIRDVVRRIELIATLAAGQRAGLV
jgi:glycerol-3-phosphate O-acyltransferase